MEGGSFLPIKAGVVLTTSSFFGSSVRHCPLAVWLLCYTEDFRCLDSFPFPRGVVRPESL